MENEIHCPKSWEQTFFEDVYRIAERSKDPRTKIGAVLVNPKTQNAFSRGYNGFPRKVKDFLSRWEKPKKYDYVVHAEANAIFNSARMGIATEGSILYTQGIPCKDCSQAIINSGISKVYVHKQWQIHEGEWWAGKDKLSLEMFTEAGIEVFSHDIILGLKGYLDNKIIDV
jgi:dCMP deaminase